MTMNSGFIKSDSNNNLHKEDIKLYLPNLKIINEEPRTAENNYIIIWDKDNFNA